MAFFIVDCFGERGSPMIDAIPIKRIKKEKRIKYTKIQNKGNKLSILFYFILFIYYSITYFYEGVIVKIITIFFKY